LKSTKSHEDFKQIQLVLMDESRFLSNLKN